MKKPRVSIALATYNGGHFLEEQLDSLLAQTYQNFEIVVSDDKSSDTTQVILETYAKKDARITWSVNPHPAGFIKNFERAISLCTGEIIFLCDQDDVWHPEKIQAHVDLYTSSNVSWVYNEVRLIDEHGKVTGYMTDTFPEYYTARRRWILNYVWGSCILGCATSYKADVLRGVLPADTHASAHDAWAQMALWPSAPGALGVFQEYRVHGNNTSDFKLERSQEESQALELRAIQDNMTRLLSFAKNKKLAFWKRCLFFVVFLIKQVRLMCRQFTSNGL